MPYCALLYEESLRTGTEQFLTRYGPFLARHESVLIRHSQVSPVRWQPARGLPAARNSLANKQT